jgi:hypothetical protein
MGHKASVWTSKLIYKNINVVKLSCVLPSEAQSTMKKVNSVSRNLLAFLSTPKFFPS